LFHVVVGYATEVNYDFSFHICFVCHSSASATQYVFFFAVT
jgi:hypothetical protein